MFKGSFIVVSFVSLGLLGGLGGVYLLRHLYNLFFMSLCKLTSFFVTICLQQPTTPTPNKRTTPSPITPPTLTNENKVLLRLFKGFVCSFFTYIVCVALSRVMS